MREFVLGARKRSTHLKQSESLLPRRHGSACTVRFYCGLPLPARCQDSELMHYRCARVRIDTLMS